MDHAAKPLQGINVLVTRPEHQCTFLAEQITNLGGNPIIFPVLIISDVKNKKSLLDSIQRLETYDIAIFVSPNAVHKTVPHIVSSRQPHQPFPIHIQIAAVGNGTVKALNTYGIDQIIVPKERFDSEALLKHEALQCVSGKQVVIFRGNGGRPLLGDTLKQRGAQLEYVTCYRRDKPEVNPSELISNWSQDKINAVVITSSEGLQNLFDIIGPHGQQFLKETPVFTAYERIAYNARNAGIKTVVQTYISGDKGILQGLQNYFCANTSGSGGKHQMLSKH